MGAAADDGGFSKVGEATDLKVRAQRVDEGLQIMAGLGKGSRICGGSTGGKKSKRASAVVRPFIDAGATWWVEPDPRLEGIRQGPPI